MDGFVLENPMKYEIVCQIVKSSEFIEVFALLFQCHEARHGTN